MRLLCLPQVCRWGAGLHCPWMCHDCSWRLGSKHKWCDGLLVHAAEEAELVFTPYNYLLDPVIRAAMKVDIRHAVLIFDEAHNIEDICRCVRMPSNCHVR